MALQRPGIACCHLLIKKPTELKAETKIYKIIPFYDTNLKL